MESTSKNDQIKKVSLYDAALDILNDHCPRYPSMYLCQYSEDYADDPCYKCLKNYLYAVDCGFIGSYDSNGNLIKPLSYIYGQK